jgi:hypothetical protein
LQVHEVDVELPVGDEENDGQLLHATDALLPLTVL